MGTALLALLASMSQGGRSPDVAFRARLVAATRRHLDLLLSEGTATGLRGKAAPGQEALAFYLTFEATGEPRYRQAAVALAEGVLRDLRATRFGVLPIKEKTRKGGERILG